MDNIVFEQLEKMEAKIDAIYVSVEKTRKYFQWTLIITVVAVVLPVIGLAFAIPSFLENYTSALGGL